ncbi:MAG: hypothetical protein RR185_04175 [Angelakisella sp.]
MVPIYFSALLRTAEGRLMELGEACLSRRENKVTFRSEFVPLVKLGTTVEIVRVLGQKQLERFRGQVYLSSRNLLQIVEVDPQLIATVRALFDTNTCLPANFTVSPDKAPVFPPKHVDLVTGTVRYLSYDTVKLSLLPYVGEGQYLIIDCQCEGLELRQTIVRVEQRELLGRRAALLLCSVYACPPAELATLHTVADRLAKLEEEVDPEHDPDVGEEPL